MKVTTNEHGIIQLEEVVIGIDLKTKDGELMTICMRDSGFEFKYQGTWYSAKAGDVLSFRYDQSHQEEVLASPTPLPKSLTFNPNDMEEKDYKVKAAIAFVDFIHPSDSDEALDNMVKLGRVMIESGDQKKEIKAENLVDDFVKQWRKKNNTENAFYSAYHYDAMIAFAEYFKEISKSE